LNEGAPKRAKAVDYQAISEIIDVKLPASYDRRKGGFSEDVLVSGSEQDRKVAHGLARNLMEGLASSICPENPAIVKSWMMNDWMSQGVPMLATTQFENLTVILATLASKVDDEVTSRILRSVLYEVLPEKKVYDLLRDARHVLQEDIAQNRSRTRNDPGFHADKQVSVPKVPRLQSNIGYQTQVAPNNDEKEDITLLDEELLVDFSQVEDGGGDVDVGIVEAVEGAHPINDEDGESDDDSAAGVAEDAPLAISISDITVDMTKDAMFDSLSKLSSELSVVVHNCKHHFQHSLCCDNSCDGESGHCARFALGGTCASDHKLLCETCKSILSFGPTFHQLVQNTAVMVLRNENDSGDFAVEKKFGI